MFQYAKKFLKELIQKENDLKMKAETQKEEIERKLNNIRRYDNLKRKIKRKRRAVFIAIVQMLIVVLLALSVSNASLPITLFLAAIGDCAIAAIFSDDFLELKKCKKEYNKLSPEEVNKLRENEENLKELYKLREKEIETRQETIKEYRTELNKMAIIEEFQSRDYLNQPFYQADTKEEYRSLMDNKEKQEMTKTTMLKEKEKWQMAFEEFQNEKVDYANVHLEVQEIEDLPKSLVKKY